MADIVKRYEYPHHFIGKGNQIDLASSQDWRNPIRFAESIGYQLIKYYGGWIMDWEHWGISVSQKIKDLNGLLIGADIESFNAAPRTVDKPILTVEQELQQFGQAAEVIGIYIEKFVMDIEQVVNQLVTMPLIKIGRQWPDQNIIVVVDGLDEVEDYSNSKQTILKNLPNAGLPPNVKFLLSSRPGQHLSQEFLSQAKIFWLSKDENGNDNPNIIEDSKYYLLNLAEEKPIYDLLTSKSLSPKIFSEKVAQASKGNFLYLYHFANGLRNRDGTLLDLEKLPAGLHGIYENFLCKIKENRDKTIPWDGAYKPVLATLAVSQEPLRLREISDFSTIAIGTIGSILMELMQFLDIVERGEERYYFIYHSSFSEYLVSNKNQDYIDGKEQHWKIAEFYLGNWGGLDKELSNLNTTHFLTLDGNYPSRHISSHLRLSGQYNILLKLLDNNKWYEIQFIKDPTGGAYTNDIMQAWLAVESINKLSTQFNERAPLIAQELWLALIITSLQSLSNNLPVNLLVALVSNKVWTSSQALAAVRQYRGKSIGIDKEEAIIKLAPHLEGLSLIDAKEIAGQIESPYQRSKALTSLVPYLFEPVQSEVVEDIIKTLRNDFSYYYDTVFATGASGIGEILRSLFNYLPKLSESSQYKILVEILAHTKNLLPFLSSDGSTDLAYILDCVPNKQEILNEVLQMIKKINEPYSRIAILISLLPHLSESVKIKTVQQIFDMCKQIGSTYNRAYLLTLLLPHLSESVKIKTVQQIFDMCKQIGDKYHRANLLIPLLPHLSESDRNGVIENFLDLILQNGTEIVPKDFFRKISDFISKKLMNKALEAVKSIKNISDRRDNLEKLILRSAFLGNIDEALTIFNYRRSISGYDSWNKRDDDKWNKMDADVLISLLPYMSESEKHKMVQKIVKIPLDVDEFAEIIASLIPHISQEAKMDLLYKLMKSLSFNLSTSEKVKAIEVIAPYLSSSLLLETLKITRTIKDLNEECEQAKLLSTLSRYLPNPIGKNMLYELLSSTLALESDDNYMTLWEVRKKIAYSLFEFGDFNKVLDAAAMSERRGINKRYYKLIRTDSEMLNLILSLPNQLKNIALEETLEEALEEALQDTLKDSFELRRALGSLLLLIPHLPEPLQSRAGKEALVLLKKIDYGKITYKAKDIAQLIINLPESLKSLALNEAIIIVDKIKSDTDFDDYINVFSALAPYLPEPLKLRTLKKAVEIIDEKIEILDYNKVDGNDEEKSNFKRQYLECVNSIASLAPFLKESDIPKLLFRGILAAVSGLFALGYYKDVWTSSALHEAIDNCIMNSDKETIVEVLHLLSTKNVETYVGKWSKVEIISDVARLRPELLENKMLKEALEYILNVETGLDEIKTSEYMHVVSAIVPHVDESAKIKILEKTDEIRYNNYNIVSSWPKYVSELLSHMPDSYREHLIEITLSDIQNVHETSQVEILELLARYMSQKLLIKALNLTLQLTSDENKIKALFALTPHLLQLSLSSLYPAWNEALHIIAKGTRIKFYNDLNALIPILIKIGEDNSATKIACAIKDITAKWP